MFVLKITEDQDKELNELRADHDLKNTIEFWQRLSDIAQVPYPVLQELIGGSDVNRSFIMTPDVYNKSYILVVGVSDEESGNCILDKIK